MPAECTDPVRPGNTFSMVAQLSLLGRLALLSSFIHTHLLIRTTTHMKMLQAVRGQLRGSTVNLLFWMVCILIATATLPRGFAFHKRPPRCPHIIMLFLALLVWIGSRMLINSGPLYSTIWSLVECEWLPHEKSRFSVATPRLPHFHFLTRSESHHYRLQTTDPRPLTPTKPAPSS